MFIDVLDVYYKNYKGKSVTNSNCLYIYISVFCAMIFSFHRWKGFNSQDIEYVRGWIQSFKEQKYSPSDVKVLVFKFRKKNPHVHVSNTLTEY